MIRLAGPSDIPAVLSLIHALAAYERAADQVQATSEQLHEALFGADAVASCFLATEGQVESESVVGFALWFRTFSTWLGRPGLYLEDLFVQPDARGRGHGRDLLGALAATAARRGYGRVEWAVLNWNEPAHGFYHRLGASPQDEWTVWRLTGEPLTQLAANFESTAGVERPPG
jgi:GNAT superfamily N-acetyltransferase